MLVCVYIYILSNTIKKKKIIRRYGKYYFNRRQFIKR